MTPENRENFLEDEEFSRYSTIERRLSEEFCINIPTIKTAKLILSSQKRKEPNQLEAPSL